MNNFVQQYSLFFIIGILLFPTYVFAQTTTLFFPTERSLPDVIPSNEFIYLVPSDDSDPTDTHKPTSYPSPNYYPTQEQEKIVVNPISMFKKDNKEPDSKINVHPQFTPPIVTVLPNSIFNTKEPNYAFVDNFEPKGVLEPQETMVRRVSPSSVPIYTPNDQIPPRGNVVTVPQDVPKLQPSGGVLNAPPTTLNIQPTTPPIVQTPDQKTFQDTEEKNWTFTLKPVEDRYPILESEITITDKEKIEKTLVVVESVPATKDAKILSKLNVGQFIQIAGYKNQFQAEKAITDFIEKRVLPIADDKLLIYKAKNATFYRVMIGPFPSSEIGIQLYHIRNKGYQDAFRVSR